MHRKYVRECATKIKIHTHEIRSAKKWRKNLLTCVLAAWTSAELYSSKFTDVSRCQPKIWSLHETTAVTMTAKQQQETQFATHEIFQLQLMQQQTPHANGIVVYMYKYMWEYVCGRWSKCKKKCYSFHLLFTFFFVFWFDNVQHARATAATMQLLRCCVQVRHTNTYTHIQL